MVGDAQGPLALRDASGQALRDGAKEPRLLSANGSPVGSGPENSRTGVTASPEASPPICKGRLGGVEQSVLYLPAPLLTKEGNKRKCRAPPYKGGEEMGAPDKAEASGEMFVKKVG